METSRPRQSSRPPTKLDRSRWRVKIRTESRPGPSRVDENARDQSTRANVVNFIHFRHHWLVVVKALDYWQLAAKGLLLPSEKNAKPAMIPASFMPFTKVFRDPG